MKISVKLNLVLYFVLSTIGFTYLVLPENSGIGVLFFSIMQCALVYFLLRQSIDKNRYGLWLFAPILLLCLTCFIYAN